MRARKVGSWVASVRSRFPSSSMLRQFLSPVRKRFLSTYSSTTSTTTHTVSRCFHQFPGNNMQGFSAEAENLAAQQLFAQHRPLFFSAVYRQPITFLPGEHVPTGFLQVPQQSTIEEPSGHSEMSSLSPSSHWNDQEEEQDEYHHAMSHPLSAHLPPADSDHQQPDGLPLGVERPHLDVLDEDEITNAIIGNPPPSHSNNSISTPAPAHQQQVHYDAISVLKWRRMKMNKHKFRKWRKRTRANRRRWIEKKKKQKELHERELDELDEQRRQKRLEKKNK